MTKRILALFICTVLLLSACVPQETDERYSQTYFTINDNVPQFTESEITAEAFEHYGELDLLGRCTAAVACIGPELMPTEERGAIGQIKPSGWQLVKYDFVDGKYLYNRCHLIGYQLSGENANEKNLITGTRYMNVEGMLPFENLVADYVTETQNHVMYRVTPIFDGVNLLAKGVQIEAYSVEDEGTGVCFNVFVNNIQPGVEINYLDGTSRAVEEVAETDDGAMIVERVLNTSSKKFHLPDCSAVKDIKAKNKEVYNGDLNQLLKKGYSPCGNCHQ